VPTGRRAWGDVQNYVKALDTYGAIDCFFNS
jgi:hypothetical protein